MIEKLTIELSLPSEKDQETAMTICDEYYQKYFQETLDNVLSQYSANNDIVINKLNIDLGAIQAEEIPYHLRYSLENALKDYISNKKLASQDSISYVNEEKEIQSTIFLNYVKNGFLDLFSIEQSTDPDSFQKELIKENISDTILFNQLLDTITKDKRAFYRMTEALDFHQILEILNKILLSRTHELEPSLSAHTIQTEDFLKNILKSSDLETSISKAENTTEEITNKSDSMEIDLSMETSNGETEQNSILSEKNIVKSTISFLLEQLLYEKMEIKEKDIDNKISEYIKTIISTKNSLTEEFILNLKDEIKTKIAQLFQTEKEKYLSSVSSITEMPEEIERIHIDDAGLIILNPFFQTLFSRLGYLNDSMEFKSMKHRIRAVHLLRAAAFGFEEKQTDPNLILSKLICGLSPLFPIDNNYRISKREKSELEDLLTMATEHWTIMKGTSIEGLQQSFLQRHGSIEKDDSSWIIRVEGKSIDILMEDLPWGFMTFSAPWADILIYVEWQKEN